MGKLIKNHWARLIILVASTYQVLASLMGFFWPKIFFDFLTTNLDPAVRPYPILQIMNLLLGILGVCWEYPLPIFITASTECALSHQHSERKTAAAKEKTAAAATETTTTVNTTMTSQSIETKRPPPPPATTKHPTPGPSSIHHALASFHRSIEARLIVYPLSTLASLLLYQATNAGLYYIIGMAVYFWAFSEGEVVMGVPWTLPRRARRGGGVWQV